MLAGSYRIDDFTKLSIIITGGLDGTEAFPITAQGERLKLNIEKLIALRAKVAEGQPINFVLDNPIENLEGITPAIEPFDIGPVTVGGGFGLIQIDTDGDGVNDNSALYGRVVGQVRGRGHWPGPRSDRDGVRPVLLHLTAGIPIPIGLIDTTAKTITAPRRYWTTRRRSRNQPCTLRDSNANQRNMGERAVRLDLIVKIWPA